MRWIERMIEKTVREIVDQELDQIITHWLEKHLSEKFKAQPDIQLTEVGFGWALGIALKKHWPDITIKEASRQLWDFLDEPFGAPGYEWTPRAASDLARQYAEEFGEP